MAQNRDELKNTTEIVLVPEIDAEELRDYQKDAIIDSVVLRKDVILTTNTVASTITLNYTAYDLIVLTISVGITISFSGLINGDVKYLKIIKPANKTIAFAGTLNATPFQNDIDVNETTVLYALSQKDGVNYVMAIRDMIKIATVADIENSEAYKLPTAKAVHDFYTSKRGGQADISDRTNIKYVTGLAVKDWATGALGPSLLKTRLINAFWNMDNTSSITILHNVPNAFTKVTNVSVVIQESLNIGFQTVFMLNHDNQGYVSSVSDTHIIIHRKTGGYFDAARFSTAVVRVTVQYIA